MCLKLKQNVKNFFYIKIIFVNCFTFLMTAGLGSKGFQNEIARGVPYFGVYCIFINKFIENLPEVLFWWVTFLLLITAVIIIKIILAQINHNSPLFWGKSFFKENVSVLCDHILSEIDFYSTWIRKKVHFFKV
jgi:hypothetical protein